MNLAEIPLLSMLKGRLGHLSERQRLIAQNVANSDTPGYKPHDLKPFSFSTAVSTAGVQAVTQPGHMTAPSAARKAGFKTIRTADSETTLNGNSVVLEEEMIKLTDSRMSYDAAISFYQKSVNMLRMAARKPGAG